MQDCANIQPPWDKKELHIVTWTWRGLFATMKSGAQQWSNQEFPGWESVGAAGQIEEVGPGLFSALLPGTDIDAVWVAELQRRPGSLSTLSSMLTLLTRCPLASPPCVGMSVRERFFWRCEGVRADVSVCLSDPWLVWDCVCVCVW